MNPHAATAKSPEAKKGPWERFGWLLAAVWLVFLIYPVLALLESRAATALVALGWLGTAAFAVIYLIGFSVGMRIAWDSSHSLVFKLFIAALLAVAATIPAIGWNATSFLPFLMSYVSYGFSRVWHWVATVIGVSIMLFETGLALSLDEEPPWALLAIVVMLSAVNTINTWLISRSIVADRLRLELATSEERESLARDVHDLLGHSLTVVKLKAELAMRLIDKDPGAARAELEEITRLTGEAIAGVRGTVTGLRSSGLAEQLQASRSALESAGVAVTVSGDTAALSPAQSLPAGWVLREATTNVLRHAEARHVRISIEPGTVVIEDDGVGVRARAGNGLRGMAERAAAAGATLRIEPSEGLFEGLAQDARPTTKTTPPHGGPGTRVSLTW